MISVIVPVYNVEKYLRKCVDSIIYQSYSDLEIILVDDGSTDGCPAICDEYACLDKRVRVIHQDHMGISATRNTGMDIATGEYLTFVDSEDYIMPNMYERMLVEMKVSEADIVMCGFLNIDGNDCYQGKSNFSEWTGSGIEFLKSDGLVHDSDCNKLYRSSLFDVVRFPAVHEVFLKASKVCVIPNLFYVHLDREGGISAVSDLSSCVDYLKALVGRLECLLSIGAEEKVVSHNIKQLYIAWNRLCSKGMFNDPQITVGWEETFTKFRLITKGISKNWSLSNKGYLGLLRINPWLLQLALGILHVIKKVLSWCRRIASRLVKPSLLKKYSNYREDISIPRNVYESEYDKYKSALKSDNPSLIVKRMKAFSSDDFVLRGDNLALSDDQCVPTVVVVVRNELERMRLFYEHYRKLGVRQFVVLDNDSSDGTLEFLQEQPDTRVYQCCTEFQTQRKEGWIEKLLALTGYNRWYIVVDSDELLDYIGSETRSVETLIRKVHSSGIRRVRGYMLDMYSHGPLFGSDCDVSDVVEQYHFFDRDGYYTKGCSGFSSDYILGGPRLRVFGTYLVLSKQAIFYFDEHTLYRDCHNLLPVIPVSEMPTLFVLRHYKFLNKDYDEYQRRIKEGNFYNNSAEYRQIMNQVKDGEISLYYHNSCEYCNSDSLRCLPYLEEMTW